MKRKKIMISAIVIATVIMAGGGGVYAFNYNQQVREEQQKLEEQKKAEEQERIKQEEEKRLEEEEQKRLEEARKVIDQELEDLSVSITALYSDSQKELLAEGVSQDTIDAASAELEAVKEKYKENPDISKEQIDKLQNLEKDLQDLLKMYEILTAYNALYPNGQLVAPKTETDEAVITLKEKLKELEGSKLDFFQVYSEKLSEVESSFAFQRSVQEAINMIYNKEAGTMVAGVTRQQYNDVLAAVETMPDNELKAELRQYLTVVDQTLTAQEEVAKTQKVSFNGSSSSGSSSSNENKTSSDGNNLSGSKGSSGKGLSAKGSSGGGSSSSGSGGSGSGNSSGGNNSSGSGSSGSSNSSSDNGSSGGGNNSSGNNDSDGYGSWEGTITGGGETKGGGTWESFEW